MPTKRNAPKAQRRKTTAKTKARSAAKAKVKATPKPTRRTSVRTGKSAATHVQAAADPRKIFDNLLLGVAKTSDPNFRDAPEGWTPAQARSLAAAAGLALDDDHWEVIRVLQGCYKDELKPRIRLLRDALDARFAGQGGMKYLFAILPGGPIARGCVLAGVKPPHGATDFSFGSVA